MTRATLCSGIDIEYDTVGDPSHPALLLVMGFTAQMTAWQDDFCRSLAGYGRYVIRFDNRDCGLSTKFDGVAVDLDAVLTAMLTGGDAPDSPYTLSDMAADAIGLLDHLDIGRAHVVGASMGGMIAQTMAIEYPERVISLTSIMSTPGDLRYGEPSPEALAVLLAEPPDDRDAVVDRSLDMAVWSSRRHFDPEATRAMAGFHYDRSFYPQGASRQLAAICASGDRSDSLRCLSVPTLVVHGLDDTLIPPSAGRKTAEIVPGAHLLEVADMGHDMPVPLWPLLVPAIVGHGSSAMAVAPSAVSA